MLFETKGERSAPVVLFFHATGLREEAVRESPNI